MPWRLAEPIGINHSLPSETGSQPFPIDGKPLVLLYIISLSLLSLVQSLG